MFVANVYVWSILSSIVILFYFYSSVKHPTQQQQKTYSNIILAKKKKCERNIKSLDELNFVTQTSIFFFNLAIKTDIENISFSVKYTTIDKFCIILSIALLNYFFYFLHAMILSILTKKIKEMNQFFLFFSFLKTGKTILFLFFS